MRTRAARLSEQRAARLLDVGEQRLEDARLDRGIVAQSGEQLLLPLELLQDVGLEVARAATSVISNSASNAAW
jgi:hypothetical protein